MKVMLIDPPGFMGHAIGRILGSFGTNKADQAWPPYDLQVMAGYCRKNRHDFKILDANNLRLSYEDVYKEIKSYNPDWVIYLTCFPNFILDAQIASAAKRVSPYIKTACMSLSIFSVREPETQMRKIVDLDYIPWGEPEITLMKLINGEEPKNIRGLYYRDSDGSVNFIRRIMWTGGEAERVRNLDDLGVPVHSSLPVDIYKCPLSLNYPMAIVNCSRGCINWCVHCQAGAFQKPLRYRSVDNVLEELHEVRASGIKEIKFYDCSLPTNKEFTEQLCKAMIEEKFNFTWNCNVRAEVVNEEILMAMKEAGCHTIAVGCDSANPQILKNMRKNETVEQIEKAVYLVKKSGMRVLMYLTFGLEGETKETMEETYRFVKRLKPEFVTFGIVVPAPGTPFYDSLERHGSLLGKDLEYQDPNALPSFLYPHLPPDDILNFTRAAYRDYYFSKGYILSRLKGLRSSTEFKAGVENAYKMVRRYVLERVR